MALGFYGVCGGGCKMGLKGCEPLGKLLSYYILVFIFSGLKGRDHFYKGVRGVKNFVRWEMTIF